MFVPRSVLSIRKLTAKTVSFILEVVLPMSNHDFYGPKAFGKSIARGQYDDRFCVSSKP